MQTIHSLSLAAAALAMALLAGCDNPKEPVTQTDMPAVNDENCTPEYLAKVDKSIRDRFASACLRRGSFQPSERKTW